MKSLRVLSFVLSFFVSAAVSARAGVTVSSPYNNDQVSSSFKLSAWATSCGSQSVAAMGYSFDSSSDTTFIDSQSIDKSISAPSGHHTLHVKAWGKGTACVADVDIDVSSGGSAGSDSSIVPSVAKLVSSLNTMSGWSAKHDSGGPGSSSGSSKVVDSPSLSGSSREFETAFSNSGDERYSLSFSDDTSSENFFYDTWVYVTSSSRSIANLEFDVNQTMSDGNTVMFGLICDGYSQHWAYTVNRGSGSHPSPVHIAKSGTYCNPRAWSQDKWHHLQAYYSRDSSGYITYHDVWLDGTKYSINEKVFGKYDLGWGPVINTQFQVDGLGSSHNTVYLANLSVSRW
jgi:hypothetical protein